LFFVGLGNFFWFLLESMSIGGDALNGYARDGHYFVASHGTYTEVAEATWTWSRMHALSVFVTHPLGIAAGFVFILTGGPLLLAGLRGSTEERRQRAEWALAGEFHAAESVRVQVGGIPLQRSTTVVVTGRGLVARIGWETITVLGGEIRDVVSDSTLGRRRLSVGHDGVDIPSPLVIQIGPSSTLLGAIERARTAHELHLGAARIAGGSDRRRPSMIVMITAVAGLAVTGIVLGIGVFEAIPHLGLFGWLWTAGVVAIGFMNARRWWRTLTG